MQIIGIYLRKGNPEVIKSLKEETWYPFGNYPECKDLFDSSGTINKKIENAILYKLKTNQEFTNELYKVNEQKSTSINLNCIVGKNGSGKSSLINLELRILNNVACKLGYYLPDFNQNHKLIWTTGFDADLYYEQNGMIHCIRIDSNSEHEIEIKDSKKYFNRLSVFYNGSDKLEEIFNCLDKNSTDKTKQKELMSEAEEHFFYSIGLNYSIYSNAIVKNKWTDKKEEWQKEIFHKNDGYLTPIVLVPYKQESIDFVKELSLAEERVTTLSLLVYGETKKSFIGDLIPDTIQYQIIKTDDYEKICKEKLIKTYFRDDRVLDGKEVIPSDDDIIKRPKDLSGALKLLWYFYKIRRYWRCYLSTVSQYKYKDAWDKICKKENENKDSPYEIIRENTLSYLSYKILKMCKHYDIYRKEIGEEIKPAEIDDNTPHIMKMPELIDKILRGEFKKDFTNLKLYQCLEFLKNLDLYVGEKTISDLCDHNKNVIKVDEYINKFSNNKLTYDEVFVNYLPPYFIKELYFKDEVTKEKNLTLSSLSSGQSQLLNSISYAIYHMKNASSESIGETKNRIEYKNMNIIIDEAELYYHPEYQRQYIYDMIRIIERGNLKNVKSINITIITHSPFMLSDIPSDNILALEEGLRTEGIKKTLGANFYDLLKNQFFMNSSIGSNTENFLNEILLDYSLVSEKSLDASDACIEKIRNKYKKSFYSDFVNNLGDSYLNSVFTNMIDLIVGKNSYIERRRKELEKKLGELNEKN